MHDTDISSQLSSEGWKQRDLPGFMGTAGPLWTRKEGHTWAYGLLVQAPHLNPAGSAHGGALMTLVDHAVSAVAWEICQRKPCVTLQMDCHFYAAVQPGQFTEVRAKVTHQTGSLVFASAIVTVKGEPVFTCQAILKKLSS